MAFDRFLIAPFDENSGLNTSLRPWQIPDQAWSVMENAYVFRGRIRKRFGSRYVGSGELNSRLRQIIGVTTGGAFSGTVPGNGLQYPALGQMFSVGLQLFTVCQTGTPAAMLHTGVGTGTYNTTSGAVAITGTTLPNNTAVYWYPSSPVMGFAQYEFAAINSFPTFGFDQQFAYTFNGTGWVLSNGSPTWNGTDDNFFWSENYTAPNAAATALTRSMFTTNFQVAAPNGVGLSTDDPIYYWNNTTWVQYTGYAATNTAKTAFLNPAGGAPGTGPFIQTALIIVQFHGRLCFLNTIENDGTGNGTTTFGNNINYVNRVRFTSLESAFAVDAWYPENASDNAGGLGTTANFLDAWTSEAIVSAEFIKDRLIVYFEESSWELVYQGNEQEPFRWQKLNTELGSMATFSTIAFDKAVLTVGETGIHSCNGSNVVRIDNKIPDQVFNISNQSNEVSRICGIRDYYNELVYWSVPEDNQRSEQYYPTQVLIYNYQNETWAFNDDTITAMGYFDGNSNPTWSALTGTWQEWTAPWNSGTIAPNVRQIIAGNQEGFTFILEPDSEVATRNSGNLQITNMTQVANGIQMDIYNHMLDNDDYICVETAQGVVLNGFTTPIYQVIYVNQNRIIATYPPEVVLAYGYLPTFTGTYTGGGTVATVWNYNLQSKQWNPYDKDGSNVYVAKIDFAVLKTPSVSWSTPGGNYTGGGAVTVNYSPSSTFIDTLDDARQTNSITGTGVLETTPYSPDLYPLEFSQNRLWHPVYFQSDGECIQIQIEMSPLQICTPFTAFADLEIEAIILSTMRTSERLQ